MSKKLKEFLSHYQNGCWLYPNSSMPIGHDPAETMHDLGMTFMTMPEHWIGSENCEENFAKYMDSARKLGMKALVFDSHISLSRFSSPTPEQTRDRIKFYKENYGDDIWAFMVCDEPWWKQTDGGAKLNQCMERINPIREIMPDTSAFIAFLPGPNSPRYHMDYKAIRESLDIVNPEFLLYNVYSQCMAEDNEKEQGIINFYCQLKVFSDIAKERKIPLWISLLITSCWVFHQPSQNEIRWQLNVCAAHGVKGFMWYHLQDSKAPAITRHMAPLTHDGQKTPRYEQLKYENNRFMDGVAKQLEGYELDDVYHVYKRYANFKYLEFDECDIIDSCTSKYNRHLIVSIFKKLDGSGRKKVMVTNGDVEHNNHFVLKFKGEYEKYSIGAYSGYLAEGACQIINLFDGEDKHYDWHDDEDMQELIKEGKVKLQDA